MCVSLQVPRKPAGAVHSCRWSRRGAGGGRGCTSPSAVQAAPGNRTTRSRRRVVYKSVPTPRGQRPAQPALRSRIALPRARNRSLLHAPARAIPHLYFAVHAPTPRPSRAARPPVLPCCSGLVSSCRTCKNLNNVRQHAVHICRADMSCVRNGVLRRRQLRQTECGSCVTLSSPRDLMSQSRREGARTSDREPHEDTWYL